MDLYQIKSLFFRVSMMKGSRVVEPRMIKRISRIFVPIGPIGTGSIQFWFALDQICCVKEPSPSRPKTQWVSDSEGSFASLCRAKIEDVSCALQIRQPIKGTTYTYTVYTCLLGVV